MKRALWVAALLLLPATAVAKPAGKPVREQRCGWIVNPTPANWSLVDRDGEWALGAQGGYQAPGLDTLPDLTTKDWVVTNGSSYGYGCGCMSVDVDKARHRIARLHAFTQKPLKVCRADRRLKRPF